MIPRIEATQDTKLLFLIINFSSYDIFNVYIKYSFVTIKEKKLRTLGSLGSKGVIIETIE